MTKERFDALVQRLEAEAAQRPRLYRLKVSALAALGYGYILGVLAVVLALAAGFAVALVRGGAGGVLRIELLLLVFAWTIARSLWVKFSPPDGVALAPADAPLLFERVEEIRRKLAAPEPHVTLINGALNAGVTQLPRLGIFGWSRNYLVLGLPLLLALPRPEFEAVLAHEFGHLAGAHGRFGAWVYRLRASWSQLLGQLASQRRLGTLVFRRFAAWYGPVFDAYSFVQARKQEVEADRMSAELGGARSAGDALVRMLVAGQLREEFWRSVQGSVRRSPEPPADVYAQLADAVAIAPDPERASRALERALAARTSSTDTHPCLRDRLAALAVDPRPPGRLGESAARALLGAALPRIAEQLSARWRAAIAEDWGKGYARACAERQRLEELEAEAQRQPLAPGPALQRAEILAREARLTEAEAALEQLAAEAPDFEPAQRALGECRLARGDERGLGQLERALALAPDPGVARTICWTAHHFLSQRGRSAEAEPWASRARQHEQALRASQVERGKFDARVHPVGAHGLDPRAVGALVERIRPVNALRDAWLVQRVLQTPGPPIYVLGVRMRGLLPGLRSRAVIRLRHEVATRMKLDERAFCVALDLLGGRARRRFMKAAGAPVYRHS